MTEKNAQRKREKEGSWGFQEKKERGFYLQGGSGTEKKKKRREGKERPTEKRGQGKEADLKL